MSMKETEMREQFCDVVHNMRAWGRSYFRWVPCRADRDDIIADAIALTWQGWRRLWLAGRPLPLSPLVIFAKRIKTAARGYSVDPRKPLRDPFCLGSRIAERLSLRYMGDDSHRPEGCVPWDHLDPKGETDPAELAALRIDWSEFVASLPGRVRLALRLRSKGWSLGRLSRKLGLSKGWLCSLLGDALREWLTFSGSARQSLKMDRSGPMEK